MKVSVVVPVYNPGQYLDDLIASLGRQSLPADEWEAIFVDDGSTDATPQRLDELAAAIPNISVIHEPNSGWPGKPRNVGIDAAKGEYIQFVDQDDWLGDEALEREYDYAVANRADVVIGKIIGIRRGVPKVLFQKSYPACSIDTAPLYDSLTPHKMFRRAFLDEIHLRFPEGKRRLEDHVFVTEAYLRASNVSVLSDYECYFHIRRDDGGNAGFRTLDPVSYYRYLGEAIDKLDVYGRPGPGMDRYYHRWMRVELYGRAHGAGVRALPAPLRNRFFKEIAQTAVARIPERTDLLFTERDRVGAALLREGDPHRFYEFVDATWPRRPGSQSTDRISSIKRWLAQNRFFGPAVKAYRRLRRP